MAIQSLTPPQDITWTRLAFSKDMIDTNFDDFAFSPKWRSSLAVYFFVVPEEETADAYPNSRILYLKLTCSITGFNPSEGLRGVKQAAEAAGTLDDLQRTLWETITSSGWASTYWPCLGAIMQLAVYPNNPAGVAPDDYPYIIDFEPKKRELFEQVTEGGEFLSGSSSKLSLTKGSTNTQSVDVSAGGSVFGIGVSASAGATWQQVENRTTDTSREERETVSHSTSFSQMYQLFNGYHLGTNRALFVVAPRPHTVSSSEQTDFNLIDGERKLEGLQDVFLVVHLPKSLDGFCIQAGLDTGHEATISAPRHVVFLAKDNDFDPENPPSPPDLPPPPPPDTPTKQLVITRRIVQACGAFDENGNFTPRGVFEPRPPVVVGEFSLPDRATSAVFRVAAGGGERRTRLKAADLLNQKQSIINRRILDTISSGAYEPRSFEATNVFQSLVATVVRNSDIPLTRLASKGYISRSTLGTLNRQKVTTLGDLFAAPLAEREIESGQEIRRAILARLLELGRR